MYSDGIKKYRYYNEHLWMYWMDRMESPSWYDDNTIGCSHPEGVIIAGSSQSGNGMKVAFMDLRRKKTVDLPDLDHSVRRVGMVYDDPTEMLILVGGEQYDENTGVSSLTKAVYKLPQLNKNVNWIKLTDLTYTVANPMLVNHNGYLYVLGGDNCATCVRMAFSENTERGVWETLDNLPVSEGCSPGVEYSGGLYSGALVYDDKVQVFTRTKMLTLVGRSWNTVQYNDSGIEQITPIIHRGMIVASVQRKQPARRKRFQPITIEYFKLSKLVWRYYRKTPFIRGIGAGRITSFQLGNILFGVS